MTDPRELLARRLRQRLELGDGPLVLEGWSREDLGRLRTEAPSPTAGGGGDAAEGEWTDERIRTAPDLEALGRIAAGCPRCRLCEGRTTVVFGEGAGDAEVLVVGEAPGADEDRSGRPFVGRAGQLLDRVLLSAGFSREAVFICNVLKCRPPRNRNPRPDEVAACRPYLERQLDLVRPRAILACGTFAAQTLLGTTTTIGKLRGRVHRLGPTPLVPTYHPAAILRNPSWGRPVWEDLQLLRGIVDPVREAG